MKKNERWGRAEIGTSCSDRRLRNAVCCARHEYFSSDCFVFIFLRDLFLFPFMPRSGVLSRARPHDTDTLQLPTYLPSPRARFVGTL